MPRLATVGISTAEAAREATTERTAFVLGKFWRDTILETCSCKVGYQINDYDGACERSSVNDA
jgi:hypothetical protein